MAIPTVGRSRANFADPFGANGRFSRLRLEEIEMFWRRPNLVGLRAAPRSIDIATQWAAFSRASVFPTLAGGLDGVRTGPRAAAFGYRLENGRITRLAAKPQPILIPLGRLLVAKET
jgi:hypothetical protein